MDVLGFTTDDRLERTAIMRDMWSGTSSEIAHCDPQTSWPVPETLFRDFFATLNETSGTCR